jgi:NADH-quinone oxidoreductase subunit H
MDIAEAESEIVAGYHTEYGGIKFGFFYQAEYLAGFAIAGAIVAMYMGGWTLFGAENYIPPWIIFLGKLYAVFSIYIWTRGTLPRLRIDQLMAFAWKFLLPIMLVNVMVVAGEVLVWRENEIDPEIALPVIGLVNFFFGAALVIAWARFLGHGKGKMKGERALLTKEVGRIYFGTETAR